VLILALDTCDARGSVALLRDESLLHAAPHTSTEDYSSWLLPAVAQVLTSAGLTLRDIDLYAVAAGPGSFTGVRVGLTTVKAWSEVHGRPIAAVSRLEAIAAQSTGSSPFVAAFIDARRNQIFAALYRRQAALLERVEEEMVIAPDKFLEWCTTSAGSQEIDWVSTDPNCLTQTSEWSSRLALNETVQEISPILAPRIGRIGYRAPRATHRRPIPRRQLHPPVGRGNPLEGPVAPWNLNRSILSPSRGKYATSAQPTRRPSPKFCATPPKPPSGHPKVTQG
jgi:tRNA threonylcarbamoyl adenosine modification protein YeaZ